MAKFSLIGNPISHSKSPALFKAAYGECEHTYTLLEAPTCKEAIHRFMEEGFTGSNVTSPFKDDVMEYISLPDRISSILGSANTILLEDGKLHSWNTDYYGVQNTLLEQLGHNCKTKGCSNVSNSGACSASETAAHEASPVLLRADGTPLKALVIGAGGAGKAAALAVKDMGMEVYFANRSSHAAKPFAQKIGAEYVGLEQIPLLLEQTDLIVYNLSMLIPQLEEISLEDKIVFEANYAHPNLADKGAYKYIDGRYWLYNQAIPAFRTFTSQEPCTAAMREVMGL